MTENFTVFVGTRSISILDNNHSDGGFQYCSSPSKDEIVSGFVKGSYLFLTVEKRDSQRTKIGYATYQYDLSMWTCVGRKVEGDGCIAYDPLIGNEWLLACPVEIGEYQYKFATYNNPNVTSLPTSSPTTPLSTVSTTGEAMAINSTETLPMDSTIISPSMVNTTSKTPGSTSNTIAIVPNSSSHFTETTVPARDTTIDTVSPILPWEYIIIILLILVIILLIVFLVCAPCCLLRLIHFLNKKQPDYISPSPTEERVEKVPFRTDTTRGEAFKSQDTYKSVEEKDCTVDNSNGQSPQYSMASLQSSGITPQQNEPLETSGPTHGRGTITVKADLELHRFEPTYSPTSIPQQSGPTDTSEPTYGTGLLSVTTDSEARQIHTDPTHQVTVDFKPPTPMSQDPSSHSLSCLTSCKVDDRDTKDPPASYEDDDPDTKDPTASCKGDDRDTKDPPASCKVDDRDTKDPPASYKVDDPDAEDPPASYEDDDPDAEDPPTSSQERLLDTEEQIPSPIPEVGSSHSGDSDITLDLPSYLRTVYKPEGLSGSHL